VAVRGPIRPETRLPLAAWMPLLDTLAEPVLLFDADGVVAFANRAAHGPLQGVVGQGVVGLHQHLGHLVAERDRGADAGAADSQTFADKQYQGKGGQRERRRQQEHERQLTAIKEGTGKKKMVFIAVGIGAVVLLTSIGEGIHRFVLAEFTQFGTNLIGVAPGKPTTLGVSGAIISNVCPPSHRFDVALPILEAEKRLAR